eukprot:scaffold625_cov420-Prasinococcus_capsulatus_cf.AAC.55
MQGGTSGIGFEISKQLGLHGCTVFVMGRRREVADGAAKALSDIGIDAYAIQGMRSLPAARIQEERLNGVSYCWSRGCAKPRVRAERLADCSAAGPWPAHLGQLRCWQLPGSCRVTEDQGFPDRSRH